jgi:hypothetical protein
MTWTERLLQKSSHTYKQDVAKVSKGGFAPFATSVSQVHRFFVDERYPADLIVDAPCPICGAHERWRWLDDRRLCRTCVVLDLAPAAMVRQGWDRPMPQADVA